MHYTIKPTEDADMLALWYVYRRKDRKPTKYLVAIIHADHVDSDLKKAIEEQGEADVYFQLMGEAWARQAVQTKFI